VNRLGIRRRAMLGALGAAPLGALVGAPPARADDAAPPVRQHGTLSVAVYQDMPPFNAAGQGIDVEIARALAKALGLRLALMPFPADDDVSGDLRNMVWKGHYLGYGPADVMLHVPVDARLMAANPQVSIFAPYWHDRVMIARDLERVPRLETLAALAAQPVAVAGQSLAGWLMIGADGGAYREQLVTSWKDGTEAAQALHRGEVAACAGLDSELESVLGGDPHFAVTPLPSPRAPRDGWAVGLAVKKDATALAAALQRAMDDLAAEGRLAQIFASAHLRWQPA
jgi:ABC-type amino acid transport substrate-binding protein